MFCCQRQSHPMANKENIWEAYKRTVKPAPLKRKKPVAHKSAEAKVAARLQAEREPVRLPKLVPSSLSLANLDRRREKALRLGDVDIDAKLDLHGLTQIEAFEALSNFMKRIALAGKRHLLVVTGKGGSTGGVLRRSLKDWLGQLPEAGLIMALHPAAPKHGGEGAYYIVMRKSVH